MKQPPEKRLWHFAIYHWSRKVNPITSLRPLAVARKLDSRAALQSFIIPTLSGGKVVL